MAVEAINAETLTPYLAGTYGADPQEVKWLAQSWRYPKGHKPLEGMFGTIGGGKPIREVMDTRKLAGQEVVISQYAGLGQRGVGIGEERNLNAENMKSNTYRFKIGQRSHSVAKESSVVNFTKIGSQFDRIVQPELADWMSDRRCMDVQAEWWAKKHTRNTIRPNNKASRDDLISEDTFSLNSVYDIKETMNTLGASPLAIKRQSDQQIVESYYIQGSNFLFADLNRNSEWRALRAQAENRGMGNTNFAGGKPMFENCILNQWEISINSANATQGARLMPYAVTGVAISATPDSGTAATTYIYGGANAAGAANTKVDYFQDFLGAPYVGFEGTKIAATTGTEYYLAVRSTSGANNGKIRLFAYQVNDGNKITITRALSSTAPGGTSLKFTTLSASGTPATWNAGDWVAATYLTEAAMPVGSIVYQCNIKGQCLCYGVAVGRDCMVSGYGSDDGVTCFGKRLMDTQDQGRLKSIGLLQVWGCAATQNCDGMVNGYCIMEAAYTPPSFPRITS